MSSPPSASAAVVVVQRKTLGVKRRIANGQDAHEAQSDAKRRAERRRTALISTAAGSSLGSCALLLRPCAHQHLQSAGAGCSKVCRRQWTRDAGEEARKHRRSRVCILLLCAAAAEDCRPSIELGAAQNFDGAFSSHCDESGGIVHAISRSTCRR